MKPIVTLFMLCIVIPLLLFNHSVALVDTKYEDSPKRIIVFPLFAEEILQGLNAMDRVVYVGHESFPKDFPQANTKTSNSIPGSWWTMCDEEELLSLCPDLIIFPSDLKRDYAEVFPTLFRKTIPVLFLPTPEDLVELKRAISLIGSMINAPEETKKVLSQLQTEEEKYSDLRFITKTKRVMFYSEYQNDFRLLSSVSGVVNVFKNQYSTAYIPLDDILLSENPEIIFFDSCLIEDGFVIDYGDSYCDMIVNHICTIPGAQNVEAVKNMKIYPITIHNSHLIFESMEELYRHLGGH